MEKPLKKPLGVLIITMLSSSKNEPSVQEVVIEELVVSLLPFCSVLVWPLTHFDQIADGVVDVTVMLKVTPSLFLTKRHPDLTRHNVLDLNRF